MGESSKVPGPPAAPRKPVFCPSTRLTLSNLDWYANPTTAGASDTFESKPSKPRNCTTSLSKPNGNKLPSTINSNNQRKVSASAKLATEFQSKSLNFNLNTSKSILSNSSKETAATTAALSSSSTKQFLNFLPLSDEASLSKRTGYDKLLKKKALSFNLDENLAERLSLRGCSGGEMSVSTLKIQVSKSFIRRKQREIMNEYSRMSAEEMMNNLRRVQVDLNAKVKLFASDSLECDL
jgi:hypothetical protein